MARLTQNVRCMGSYRQPFEGHANYGNWFASASATEQHFTSEDYGLTCAASAPVGMGNLLFIGGASYQTINYELLQDLTSSVAARPPRRTSATTGSAGAPASATKSRNMRCARR